jgi:hypothetical protein
MTGSVTRRQAISYRIGATAAGALATRPGPHNLFRNPQSIPVRA